MSESRLSLLSTVPSKVSIEKLDYGDIISDFTPAKG